MLRKDKRIKQCPNEDCSRNQKRFHFTSDDIYCTECRCGLVFACAKCGRKIEDEGPGHRLCELCIATRTDRRTNLRNTAAKTVAAVGVGASAVASGVKTAAKVLLKKG